MKLALPVLLLLAAVPASSLGAETPYACNMFALTRKERAAHEKVSRRLLTSIQEQKELENGFAFRLPAEHLAMTAEWVSLERKCCPFFTFQMELPGNEGPLWLRVTGAEGIKPFILSEFGLAD